MSAGGAPVEAPGSGIFLILYPEGAEFRAARARRGRADAGGDSRRRLLPANRDGRAVVSFIEPNGETPTGTDGEAHASQPPVTIDPVGADDATFAVRRGLPAERGRKPIATLSAASGPDPAHAGPGFRISGQTGR